MEKIAIIGMGTSGTAVLDAYAKFSDKNTVEIHCFDRPESFGRGYPYKEDSHQLIVNLKTPKITYDFTKGDDFVSWYKEQGKPVPEYASRDEFGQYMKSRLMATMEKFGAIAHYDEIINMDLVDGKWRLESSTGQIDVFDRVHLCNGEVTQKSIYSLEGKDNYIHDIYPVVEKLASVKPEDKVCVIGSGLTGVDVTTYLLEDKGVKDITFFSRSNRIPSVRVAPVPFEAKIFTMEKLEEVLKENFGRIPFQCFDELFLEELKAQGIESYEDFISKHNAPGIKGLIYNMEHPDDLAIVQAILPPMNKIFNKVWDNMTTSDRIEFRKKYHPFMCLNRSPLPQISAEILIKAYEDGRLSMPPGVTSVEEGKDQCYHLVCPTLGPDFEAKEYDVVINATGLDLSLKGLQSNPLLAQLLDKRYVQVDPYGGINNIPETSQVISPRFGTLENLHVYGVLASGVQYRNNSTLILQITAQTLIPKIKPE